MCERCDEQAIDVSRRKFLSVGAIGSGLAMAGLLSGNLLPGGTALADDAAPAPNAISPDEALKRLVEGNARYAANAPLNKDFSADRAARAKAQFPFASILSCADSRVAPELAFDQGPGELFVVRVAGNFLNDDGLASLEFGTAVLGVPLILVLGHTGCGAVRATIEVIQDKIELPGHLPELVESMKPGVEVAIAQKPDDLLAAATIENVRYNVQRLESAGPIIYAAVAEGKVKIVGGVYDIATGKVTLV